jgi:hypothetical protein
MQTNFFKTKATLSIPLSAAVALIAILGATGCSGPANPWEKTYPVSGVVQFKGKPIPGAELAFFPINASAPDEVRPKAKSDETGRFEAWTYIGNDGLPAGKYRVTVVHHEVAVSKGTIVAKLNTLPAKYATLDRTDLQVEILPNHQETIAIDLK